MTVKEIEDLVTKRVSYLSLYTMHDRVDKLEVIVDNYALQKGRPSYFKPVSPRFGALIGTERIDTEQAEREEYEDRILQLEEQVKKL